MKIDGLTHPKTKELAFTLGIPLPHAIGLLELLWAFVAQQTPQGNIGKWSDAVISDAAGWNLDPSQFVDALVSVRYLDECNDHRLVVHDWKDHAPNWVHAKLKKQGKEIHFANQQPILDPISEPSKSGEGGNSDPLPEASTSLAKPSLAKPDSVPIGTGGEPPDPVKQIFDLGVSVLTNAGMKSESARALVGKLRKELGDGGALEAIKLARDKTDPQTFLGACAKPKLRPPADPNKVESWAKENGLPLPRPGESTWDYRERLNVA